MADWDDLIGKTLGEEDEDDNGNGDGNGNGKGKDNANDKPKPVEVPDIPNKEYFEYLVKIIKKTVRQEDALIRQILYTVFSADTKDPINLGIMAPTSEGKTYPFGEAFEYLPQNSVISIGKMSKMALVRDKGMLVDKDNKPIQSEVDGLKFEIKYCKDEEEKQQLRTELFNLLLNSKRLIDLTGITLAFLEPPDPELFNLIKPILSHDLKEIDFSYVDRTERDGLQKVKVVVRGWPACIFCSAKDESSWSSWSEIQSRFLITSPNMTKAKYEESTMLIAQRKGLPSIIQDQLIVSKKEIELARHCAEYIKQQIKSTKNDFWLPYQGVLGEALKSERGTDVRNNKRIFSFLNIIPLVKSENRPQLYLKGQKCIIGLLEDLSEVLGITQNLNGIPAYKMKFFKEILCPLFKSKLDEDEKAIGVTTKDLRDKYKEKTGKSLSADMLRKLFLYELENNGLIDEEDSKEDKRYKLYYPLVSFDVDSNGNANGNADDEKYRKYRNQSQFFNFLQYSPILLPKNCRLPDENWLIMEILAFLKYGIQLEDIVLHDKNGNKQTIKEFISEYEKDVSLIPYFKSVNSSNSHKKISTHMMNLCKHWIKDVEKCRIDSNSGNSAILDPENDIEESEPDAETNPEEPQKCPSCGEMVPPYNRNIHPACCKGLN